MLLYTKVTSKTMCSNLLHAIVSLKGRHTEQWTLRVKRNLNLPCLTKNRHKRALNTNPLSIAGVHYIHTLVMCGI